MEKKKVNKLSIFLIIAIIILIFIMIVVFCGSVRHAIFRFIGIEAKEGNTIGNINNLGYMVEDSSYLYYMCPMENGKYIGISKVKKNDLTGKQISLVKEPEKGKWEIAGLNSYGDYIYFITFSPNSVDENDENADKIDNKIHRVNKNGNQKDEILNDNEFNNYDYKMVVVDGKIYYIGEDECIWYMDLDGKNKTRLNENATGFEAINDKYIIYNMPIVKDGKDTSISYIMDRDGKNAKQINGERIFEPIIYKDYIYYITEDYYPHRMTIDGKNDEMLSDLQVYNLNVSDNGIYYFKEDYSSSTGEIQSVSICKMDLDGKNNKKIYTLHQESVSLCLAKDLVFFLDSTTEQGMMEVISPDGKQKIDLYVLNYSDYYYKDQLIEEKTNELLENTEISEEDTTENVAK